ncbi:MAG: prephenate dehydrogenase/arogenate dehydrogenase family protein [Planctomycetes bacterium]|nr:prephenate dehydrogenase/arogenate dehydrogenase family protein [Planctomycetota bacterium]
MARSEAPLAGIDRVAIVGTGLLGGSLGLGLRALGYRGAILGVGRRPETLKTARDAGCVTETTTDLRQAVIASGLVVMATPLGHFVSLLEQIAACNHRDLIITDVGSTKGEVCAHARRLLSVPGRFIGSHPMAGGERHGPEFARADLFNGKPCIVTPADGADFNALNMVESMWSALGMKTVRMTPEEHDQAVAKISHLPHAVAALLVQLAKRGGAMRVASTGFADTTRVASGDAEVWTDIFLTNRAALSSALDELAKDVTRLRDLLQREDMAAVRALLDAGKGGRDELIETWRHGED